MGCGAGGQLPWSIAEGVLDKIRMHQKNSMERANQIPAIAYGLSPVAVMWGCWHSPCAFEEMGCSHICGAKQANSVTVPVVLQGKEVESEYLLVIPLSSGSCYVSASSEWFSVLVVDSW